MDARCANMPRAASEWLGIGRSSGKFIRLFVSEKIAKLFPKSRILGRTNSDFFYYYLTERINWLKYKLFFLVFLCTCVYVCVRACVWGGINEILVLYCS